MQEFYKMGQVVLFKTIKPSQQDQFFGRGKKNAFISFFSKDQAMKAKEELNGKMIDKYVIQINFKRPRSDFKPDANLVVKGLKKSMNPKEFEKLFSQYGPLVSSLLQYGYNGEFLGYGYIQYENEQDANAAIKALNKKDGMVVEKYQSNKQKQPTKNNVHIRNFQRDWDEKKVESELDSMCKKAGKVVSKNIYKIPGSDQFPAKIKANVAFETGEQA